MCPGEIAVERSRARYDDSPGRDGERRIGRPGEHPAANQIVEPRGPREHDARADHRAGADEHALEERRPGTDERVVLHDDRPRARGLEDAAFVGAGSSLLEGVLVGSGAVIGAGVVLTGTSRLYDLVRGRVLAGTPDEPLSVPSGAVVVPGSRSLDGGFAGTHGLSVSVALLVKDRDAGTDARLVLEDALR